MQKIIYTRADDGGVSIINPSPKERLERVLGTLTEAQYEEHVWTRSVPDDAIDPRYIDDLDIPPSREFRNAWCDVTSDPSIDISCSLAKEIQLEKLRLARQEEFVKLGFGVKFHKEIEDAILSPATRKELQRLRDITNPLKELDVSGKINCKETLALIRSLGTLQE